MGYVVILLIVYLYFIRMISAYHSKLIFKKHIKLKNEKLAKILIASKIDGNSKVYKRDKNKLLYIGIVFYMIWLLLLVFSIVMLKFIPSIPIDTNFYINTVNMRIVTSLVYSYGMALVGFFLINRYHTYNKKLDKVFPVAVSCLMVFGIMTNLLLAFGI